MLFVSCSMIKCSPLHPRSVHVRQGSTPVLGVVHVPVSGKTYYAVAGKGAYVQSADGSAQPIQCQEFAITDPGLTLVGSASHAGGEGGPNSWHKSPGGPRALAAGGNIHCYCTQAASHRSDNCR